MRRMLILGGGTAGTMLANRLARDGRWSVTVVDRDDDHLYQPGLLFLPFDASGADGLVRSRRRQLDRRASLVLGEVDRVVAPAQRVDLIDGRSFGYDTLVIATGTTPRPDQVPGLLGPAWRHQIFDFYTLSGARALSTAIPGFAGRLVVHLAETPIKCPVAPLEFAFLADAALRRDGRRAASTITYVTPLDGAFTRPVASRELAVMLAERGIELETDFVVERVDQEARTLISYDGREILYDLLVTVPPNMGADFVARSQLGGDELNHIPVDPHTFAVRGVDDVYAIGDAADLPTSKAGSVAHFEVESLVRDLERRIAGMRPASDFDGHANCFVESGNGQAILLDFNYDVEPLPGRFPWPYVGPLRLLKESRLNHLGKRAFAWVYWHLLLPGRPLPIPRLMSHRGKHRPAPPAPQAPPTAQTPLAPPAPTHQESA